jgi:integrative and conjugative element protein (TIGR02256 family)
MGRAGWSNCTVSITWRCRDFRQALILADDVLEYVRAHQQRNLRATEAGGQLFGAVTPEEVLVSVATGPYAEDERSRYGYRSDPRAADKAIETQEAKGHSYLGEWHTHAEGRPTPSSYDTATMSAIARKSTLRAGAAMMLIVGQSSPPGGLYVGTFEKGRFRRWSAERPESLRCRLTHWIPRILR